MKYFIAFLLLLFAPSFVPNTAFAAINPAHIVSVSTTLPQKKLTFKEKLLRKLLREDGEKLSKIQIFFLIGALLLVVGVILIIVGDAKGKAAPQGGLVPSFDGLGETILGLGAIGLGCISLIIGKSIKKKKPQEAP